MALFSYTLNAKKEANKVDHRSEGRIEQFHVSPSYLLFNLGRYGNTKHCISVHILKGTLLEDETT
jgi:hypothetical protein